MLLIRGPIVKKWLKLTRNNQKYLAEKYGVKPSYISQIIHNQCNISGNFVGFIVNETKMRYEDLFLYVPVKDERKFLGEEIWCEDQFMDRDCYTHFIKNKLKEINVDNLPEKV